MENDNRKRYFYDEVKIINKSIIEKDFGDMKPKLSNLKDLIQSISSIEINRHITCGSDKYKFVATPSSRESEDEIGEDHNWKSTKKRNPKTNFTQEQRKKKAIPRERTIPI
jgi:hypothetical protein